MLSTLRPWLARLLSRLRTRDGQAMVEYALILALIAIVVIVALHFLGGAVNNQLSNVANTINST